MEISVKPVGTDGWENGSETFQATNRTVRTTPRCKIPRDAVRERLGQLSGLGCFEL